MAAFSKKTRLFKLSFITTVQPGFPEILLGVLRGLYIVSQLESDSQLKGVQSKTALNLTTEPLSIHFFSNGSN